MSASARTVVRCIVLAVLLAFRTAGPALADEPPLGRLAEYFSYTYTVLPDKVCMNSYWSDVQCAHVLPEEQPEDEPEPRPGPQRRPEPRYPDLARAR